MCGRFTLTSEIKEIREHFSTVNQISYNISYNISPAQNIPVVRLAPPNRELSLCHWGLIPHWSKPDNKYQAINARAETLAEKPFFRDAFKKRRCLIPANGFFEWKKQNDSKQAYYFQLKNSPLFAFAALWEYWQGENGLVESCTIITTSANVFMQPVHDRMPVIIEQKMYGEWLETGAKKLLIPYPGEMDCYPVSKSVNNPRYDDKDLIEPIQ